MTPSAWEVEEVILATLRRGHWVRAVTLLSGAARLPCLPTARTYREVVAAVATSSMWEYTVRLLDLLQTSPLSARALYHTAMDAVLVAPNNSAPETLLAIIVAARHRQVALVARHYLQCCHLLLGTGDWRGVLIACSQERLVEHAPALAHPTMLAAATGRQWMIGFKIMTSLLASGSSPSGDITENFIRCFTPVAPWWRALAVAAVFACSKEPNILRAASNLRTEVRRGATLVKMDTAEKRRQAMMRMVTGDSAQWMNALTLEEAREMFAAMEQCHWEKTLLLLRQFPSLLGLTPQPRALLFPMTPLHIGARRCCYWELVLQAVLSPLSTNTSASVDDVLTMAKSFFVYVHNEASGDNNGAHHKWAEAIVHAMGAHLKTSYMVHGRTLEPSALASFVHTACMCSLWKEALFLTERPVVVFNELVNVGKWEAATAVHAAMQASAQQRTAFRLEHLFISRGLWVPALQYAQRHLPGDTLALRNLALPLCAALGHWRRALWMMLKYVPHPTEEERMLRRRCIVQHAEDSVGAACAGSDWVRGLLAWRTIHQFPRGHKTASEELGKGICMSSHAVMRLAKLLLDHQRYDECCMVVAAHTPNFSDPILLCCLHLFHHIRQSPTSYGRVLQQYKEALPRQRVMVDMYAVLALGVSRNYGGAFSTLRDLTLWQHAGARDAIARGLDMVPQAKRILPSILSHIVGTSQAVDLEAVVVSLMPCVRSPMDVDLFNEPMAKLVESGCDILRGCARRLAIGLLRHMLLLQELPVPCTIVRILAEGLECHATSSVVDLLYHAVLRGNALNSPACRIGSFSNDDGDCNAAPLSLLSSSSSSSSLSEEEIEALFRRCAEGFIKAGNWGSALDAIRRCKTTDAETLFRTTLLLREERARHERMVHRVMTEEHNCVVTATQSALTDDGEDGEGGKNRRNSFDGALMSGSHWRQTEDTLMALTRLRAWRVALAVFNKSSAMQYRSLDGTGVFIGGGGSSSNAVGALLSCVATSGAPWETTLQLLGAVQQGLPPGATMISKGLTDVLRCVGRRSGAMMCSRVLVFMVEEMGVVPRPEQYEVMLHACLDPRLRGVARDMCAANLRRLSAFLIERQITDFVMAITVSNISPDLSGEEHDHGDHNVTEVAHPFAIDRINTWSSPKLRSDVGAANWMLEERRPPLSAGEIQELSRLASFILLATSRGLEGISRQAFSGRFRPFDLRLLLQHYRPEVLAEVGNDSTGTVDTQLVVHCRGNSLLHVMLLPYEHEHERKRLSSRVDGEYRGDAAAVLPTFLEQVRQEVFYGFLSRRTMAAVWAECRPFAERLAAQRWPCLCEYELLREVRRRRGRPPTSLITRPGASRSEISTYWATYGRIVWPELFFSGPELCQLAVYVPLVEPLLFKPERERELCNLLADIQAAHFTPEAIPQQEELLRRPHSVDAVHAVFKLAFKMLKRLFTELEVDSRDRRYYYCHHHRPDSALWRRHSQQKEHGGMDQDTTEVAERSPRWSLALRILHHYRRSTTGALQPRAMAALFAACAADAAELVSHDASWWVLAIHCARSVEPMLCHETWRHAMQLASKLSHSRCRVRITTTTDAYRVEDICDASLQATTRAMLSHVNREIVGGRIPSTVSLLLLERMRELLSESFNTTTTFNGNDQCVNSYRDDAIIVWALLHAHRCMDKMDPLHALALQRLVLEGQSPSGMA